MNFRRSHKDHRGRWYSGFMREKSEFGDVAKSVLKLFEKTQIDDRWSFAECGRKETGKWTHGHHRYTAKFNPQIVEKLFDEYITDGNAHINDPFFGSGTTIVSAIARGYRASGTDINGIAYLMTKVKSTPIEPLYLKEKVDRFLIRIKEMKDIVPEIPHQHLERINYWFDEPTKLELGKILRIIREESDTSVRDFLLVGFSHILKSCSIWLQRSTKPTRDKQKVPRNPYNTLRLHLNKMLRGNESFYKTVPTDVRSSLGEYLNIALGDARNQSVEDNSVDLIVSSSPYVTSYEYADLHQLSTIWLDFTEDLKQYRTRFIGSSSRPKNRLVLRSEIANDIVIEMNDKRKKLSEEIGSFFLDMEQVFVECYRSLKSGGRCCFVIGNTTLKGVNIINAQIFAESIQYSGFTLDRIIKREIPSKILPQTRDKKTGRFTASCKATSAAYPVEYIVIGEKMEIT